MMPTTSTSSTLLRMLVRPAPDVEREHDGDDAGDDRPHAEPRHQHHDAHSRARGEEKAEDDGQHADEHQPPLSVDDLAQPDGGADLERASEHCPGGDEPHDREGAYARHEESD